MRATTLFLGLIASCVVAAAPPAADLIVHDARIYTVDATHPVVQALVVRDGRVVFVGSTREAMTFRAAKTQVLDLDGAAVIPGMIDAHAHLLGLGQSLQTIDLRGTASFDAVIARVVERRAATVPGRWIVGRGWDQNDWADHPVLLERVDGHAVLVNAAALKAAGITRDTPDPAGGRIEHDAEGEPSGVLVDNAIDLVTKVMPAATPEARGRRRGSRTARG
jgi:hypothetical protein